MDIDATTTRATDHVLASIGGWFGPQDIRLFRWFLSEQVRQGQRGDLAELGVYLGKSAVLIGDYLQPGETFTVVDLFGTPACDVSNQRENSDSYPDLTRGAFEANYLRAHDELPRVVTGLSSSVVNHAAAGSHRFIHVDASHHYDHVRADIAAAEQLLGAGGIVAFDDIRSSHTPGVSAAVWEAVTLGRLNVVLVGDQKLYGTFSDPEPWRAISARWLPGTGLFWERQSIAGDSVLRVSTRPPVSAAPGPLRRAVRAVAPPIAIQAAVAIRDRRRARSYDAAERAISRK